ncbi:MAG: imidazole glycerol phosphate synthase subunit HisH [Candidatus Hadarchaeales archaeon]
MVKISIVDYGVGNLHSIRKAIEFSGAKVLVTKDPKILRGCDAIVLPGVGAFSGAMSEMPKEIVIEEALSGKPIFGICLGMQLLFEYNEEGNGNGLCLVKGRVVRLPNTVKIPHIGWNIVEIVKNHPIVKEIPAQVYMYFVHSYYVQAKDKEISLANSKYGVEFPSIIASENIFGTQFHPEKSGVHGLKIIKNFVSLLK